MWFVLVAPVIVAEVFRSPMVDYRLVALGAALPLIEVVAGRPFLLHTLLAPVVVLTLVMLTTMNRRLLRRRALAVPIGMFLHLVLDGAWSSGGLFWWPAFGSDFGPLGLPEANNLQLRLLAEVAAAAVGAWAYRRYGLHRPVNRQRLIRTGHLAREYVS